MLAISSISARSLPWLLAVLLYILTPSFSSGQSLVAQLKWLRTQEIARQHFSEYGFRLRPLPLDPLDVKSDSIRQWISDRLHPNQDSIAARRPDYRISFSQRIDAREIDLYQSRFAATEWAFIGNTSFADVDTMLTRDIRARLEFHYGPPTRTLAETKLPTEPASRSILEDDIIEFEYWFVLNDSIPAFILDVNGPWDRGVVMAVPSLYRDILSEIKEAFLRQLTESNERTPFADYYFNAEQGFWYVTVYDGASFYDVRIERPNLEMGRPQLGDYIGIDGQPPE